MGTHILRQVSWLYVPVFFLYAFFVLLRGHYVPGGGFIAGLIAGCGLAFGAVMRSSNETVYITNRGSQRMLAIGLVIAIVSSLIPLFFQQTYFEGMWVKIPILGKDPIQLGTPLLFDVGVFAVVIAISSLFVNGFISAAEEED